MICWAAVPERPLACRFLVRAGEGNRTLMTSLEGCGPRNPELPRPSSGPVLR
jgi:hypothetical protein